VQRQFCGNLKKLWYDHRKIDIECTIAYQLFVFASVRILKELVDNSSKLSNEIKIYVLFQRLVNGC
jgi:hypothetical protein